MSRKPSIIEKIEAYYKLELRSSVANTLKEFMEYGRKEEDKNQYLEEDGVIIGLNLRTNDIDEFSFLTSPELSHLQALNLCENKLTSIEIPKTIQGLEYLDVSDMETLKELQFDDKMPKLKELDASDSKIESFDLKVCPKLERLDMSRNAIQEFTFSSNSPKLEWIDLSGNRGLKKLHLPEGMDTLTFLYLSNCEMQDLKIEGALPMLRVLDLKNNHLRYLPADVILDSPLTNLYAGQNRPKNIRAEFLGKKDSLEEAKVWFNELRNEATEENNVIKLMLTGNGNVGKTTLMCALENGDPENDVFRCENEEQDTTHGIRIDSWENNKIVYNYWDFGGQEVYHGTHRLFLASDAIQLILFDPIVEEAARKSEQVDDRSGKNRKTTVHTIDYWYHTIKHLSPNSEFLLIQNKIDKYPEDDEIVRSFAKQHEVKFIQLDAITGKDVEDLPHNMKKLAKRLPDYEMVMPSSWIKVRQFFIDNLELPKGEKQELITLSYFNDELCKDINEKSKQLLLKYLHHGGFIYYHENLNGQIIADQRWALEAIYKPFERDSEHFEEFEEDKGRVRVRRLFSIFGKEYSEEQKWLFLSFMESCGLSFRMNHKDREEKRSKADYYVLPEFLPKTESLINQNDWEGIKDYYVLKYQMPWVDHYLIRTFITKLGRKTEVFNIWRNGINIGTTDGRFRVALDHANKTLFIWIEKKAMDKWIEPILKEFSREADWFISEDKGKSYLEEPFNLEKWKSKKSILAPEREIQHEGNKGLKDQLKDVPQEAFPERENLLIFAANPISTKKLSARTEHSFIEECLQSKYRREKLKGWFYDFSTLFKINKALREDPPHFIHFIGHGEEEDQELNQKGGLILLKDDGRNEEVLSASELKNYFGRIVKLYPQLKMVFLNACFMENQAEAISMVGLYAFGTSHKVKSETARRVAMGFYEFYAESKDILQSAKEAVAIVKTEELNYRLFKDGEEIKLF